ncbi:MAG: glutathione S-transferase family protein [Gammaproteobacteria bacterium]|nr:glutathione S-transferase family protein [Gammaproteobacteria bacterium]
MSTIPAQYIIYGGELSLFTRKLEAAMIFYAAKFDLRSKNTADVANIETRSGTHQVPVLLTPENWMIADTTPLLQMLDSRFPDRRMFPEGELGVLVHVLEEHFDEWIARVMVHYRWHYPESAKFAAMRMADGNEEVAERVMNWGPRACRATGTQSPHQRQAAEQEYLRMLEAAEIQLQQTAFLLGERPTALDCIVLGGLRAHTNMDPDPKRVVAQFPCVVEWAQERADGWDGKGSLAPLSDLTGFAQHVLSEMASTYVPYVLANADAQTAGAKAFHTEIYSQDVSFLSRPYPEQARQMLVRRIHELDPAAQQVIQPWLQKYGLARAFE